jgi:predicted Zn-ribbon and HTH transcriptional regulator
MYSFDVKSIRCKTCSFEYDIFETLKVGDKDYCFRCVREWLADNLPHKFKDFELEAVK